VSTGDPADRRAAPSFVTLESGAILLYGGDVEIYAAGGAFTHHAHVELRDGVNGPLVVHAAGKDVRLLELEDLPREAFALPTGTDLTPPSDSTLPPSPSEGGWIDVSAVVNQLEHGDSARAQHFQLYLTGDLGARAGVAPLGCSFTLGDWQVELHDLDQRDTPAFECVARCTPDVSRSGWEGVRVVAQRVAMLRSFVAGSEVGVGPIVGVTASGDVC